MHPMTIGAMDAIRWELHKCGEVFVLWDGAFSLARTIDPMNIDTSIYRIYVNAAVKGSKDLQCTITPKVHLMLEHVEWQMANIEGGLGDNMEDWVERLHQTGKRQRLRYRTVQNPVVCSFALLPGRKRTRATCIKM
jgi:hypothetical protein